MSPRVVIIVLNWNGLADTLACLASLAGLDYPACEVVVVDNGSTDGSVEEIRSRFPSVTLIENGENQGFAGGNNVGLRYALKRDADYVLLLNNDTEVAPDSLRQLVSAAEAGPGIGIVGPTIYYYDEPDLIWTAGGEIDWRRGAEVRMRSLNTPDTGQLGAEPRPVDAVSGCALLVKRAVLEKAGLLDERFFTYYEEVEWCVRVQRGGFQIMHVPTAKVWHKIPLNAREHSPRVHYYMTRNRLLFLKATHAGWQVWSYVMIAMYLRTLLSWSLRPRWRHKREHRAMMIRGIVDAFRGRWGPQGLRIAGV